MSSVLLPERIRKAEEKAKKKEKYEEIKKIALEIFIQWNVPEPILNPASAWENAEDFYDYAKERENSDE